MSPHTTPTDAKSALTDPELASAISQAQLGDEGAFDRIYQCLNPLLLRFVRGILKTDPEDAVAEAWYEIARDIHRFSGDGAGFRAWTATIARMRAMDQLRRNGNRRVTTGLGHEILTLPATTDTAGQALETLSTEDALAQIAALPPDQAQAILLRVIIGLDGPTTARVLGKTPGAVRTAAYRGLRQLAKRMTPTPATARPNTIHATAPPRTANAGRIT